MRAIFFVLKNPDLLKPLIDELKKNEVTGGTLLASSGLAKEMAETSEFALFGTLRSILAEEYKDTKTLIFVANEEKEKIILDSIKKIVGDLDQPNSGIVFAMPVDYTIGLKY
ncbi:MAG: hypothetical protein RR327_00935 [Clostridia bacterium]